MATEYKLSYTGAEINEKLGKVSQLETAIADLDVQADWNQNDTDAVNYVKNRTHFEEVVISDIEVIPEMTVNITEDGGYSTLSEECPILIVGQTYTVVLNGTEYQCVARWWEDESGVLLGNGTVYGDGNEGNGEPFCVDSYDDGSVYLNVSSIGEYTASITYKGSQTVVHKLDNKYIPDDVANVDDLEELHDEIVSTQENVDAFKAETGTALADKMDTTNPVGTGAFSVNRDSRTDIDPIGSGSVSIGSTNRYVGLTSASGTNAVAVGVFAKARGDYSYVDGVGTQSVFTKEVVSGTYNISPSYTLEMGQMRQNSDSTVRIMYEDFDFNAFTGEIRLINPTAEPIVTISAPGGLYYVEDGVLWHTVTNNSTGTEKRVLYPYYVRNAASDLDSEYRYILGDGSANNYRSNAMTIDKNGRVWYRNDIYVGSKSGAYRDEGSRKLMANRDTSFILTDTSTAFQYTISIDNGSLVSSPRPFTYTVTTAPTTVTYTTGEYFDATGMVTAAVYDDGSSREVTDYQFPAEPLTAGTTEVTITATILGTEYSATTAVAVNSLDPTVYLADYTYTDNGDGTYTVTGWADTTKTDELVVPNNAFVTIGGSEE